MAAVSSEELQDAWQKVKKMGTLPEAPSPKPPTYTTRTPIKTRLLSIQHYLNALEYNYTGTLYFDVNKNRSFKSIVSTAKEIVSDILPIQCLEAVFVAGYLTANIPDLERFPISFKSECGRSVHRHIILAVRHQLNKWGALGLSRSEKLMYKELRFNSLSELIQDFRHGFESVCHTVTKIYIGFPFPHDIHSSEKVEWRVLNIGVVENSWAEVASHVDAFAKEALDVLAFKRTKGVLPDSFQTKYPLHTPEKEPGKKSPDKRMGLNSASFEFPSVPGDRTPQPATVEPESTERDAQQKKNPILVAPDHLVFKRALANQGQVLPSNVFLQNTTVSAFTVEVVEPSGQLEIVTKSTHTFSTPEEQAPRGSGSSIFQVSARGMIVIAIRCKSTCASLTESVVATASVAEPAKKKSVELKRNRTPRGTVTSPQKSEQTKTTTSAVPTRLAVFFRCTRLLKDTEDQANERESAETYVSELPFTITS